MSGSSNGGVGALLAVFGVLAGGYWFIASGMWLAVLAGILAGAVYAILAGNLPRMFPQVHRFIIWALMAATATAAGWWLIAPTLGAVLTLGGFMAAAVAGAVMDLALTARRRSRGLPTLTLDPFDTPIVSGARGDLTWQDDHLSQEAPAYRGGTDVEDPRAASVLDHLAENVVSRCGYDGLTVTFAQARHAVTRTRERDQSQSAWVKAATLLVWSELAGPVDAASSLSLHEEIARAGWTAFAARTVLTVIHQAPDPGNGVPAVLYAVPAKYGPVRVLECWDGTPGPDGTRERIGVIVPDTATTVDEAGGGSYGVPPDVYADLDRRT